MPQYKLTYFDMKGRAELSRFLFALADVEYEDNRLTEEQWASLKADSPFGQMPLLETEGVTLCQSNVIARYLARKFGFAGKSDLDQARADMIVDCTEDMSLCIIDIFKATRGGDEKKGADLTKKAIDELYPASMVKMERILKQNNGGDGWFVGDEITYADLAFVAVYAWSTILNFGDQLEKTPKLKALHDKVLKQPRIAAWIAKRPVTEM